jgi:hypothetical protein
MKTARKNTVEVPAELLERAQRAGGTSMTQTVRTGLQLVAMRDQFLALLKHPVFKIELLADDLESLMPAVIVRTPRAGARCA